LENPGTEILRTSFKYSDFVSQANPNSLRKAAKSEAYKRRTAQLYDTWADLYDEDNEKNPYYAHFNRSYERIIVAHRGRLGGPAVVDIGCGTGAQSLFLARLGYYVIGVDISSRSIRKAREKARRMGLETRVDFVVADACHLPFRDGAASSVVSFGLTLNHIMDQRKPMLEISRTLSSNGYFILEFENKWSVRLIYLLIEAILDSLLHRSTGLRQLLSYSSTGVYLWSPLRVLNRLAPIPLRTVSLGEVKSLMSSCKLKPNGVFGIHILTVLMPSLERQSTKVGNRVLKGLARFDDYLTNHKVFQRIAHSFVVAGPKED
jgi:ubiquinone/menaquinone biosynthesis C-methylase UbiE